IRGYPSLVAELATWLEANGGVPPSSVRGVAYSSEVATRSQLRTIQRVFGFQPVGLYGHTERTVMAATCEHGRYHPWPQYGLIELLDATGNRIDEPGVEGEIVTTSLQPRATVFARYRTGDRGEWAPNCGCGLTDRVLGRIAGRTRE